MKKRFLKNLAYGTMGLALLVGTHIILPNNNILKPRDFDNANWIKYDNKSEGIYDYYEEEVGSLNVHNWYLYLNKVKEKNSNKNNLERMIWLPDLDDDGKVGKIKNPNLKN